MNKCTIDKHEIVTSVSTPINQRNQQIPKHWEVEINEGVKKLLKAGIIAESKSAWASRIVPVRKKNGEIRMCIDFRKLNEVTDRDSYPLPRIDEIIDELSEAKIFSSLDATSGYYQIELSDSSKDKTAFRWKKGLYEYSYAIWAM